MKFKQVMSVIRNSSVPRHFTEHLTFQSNDFLREIWSPRPLVSAGGYTRETALEAAETTGNQLVAFGRLFISNVRSPSYCDHLYVPDDRFINSQTYHTVLSMTYLQKRGTETSITAHMRVRWDISTIHSRMVRSALRCWSTRHGLSYK